jgi:hypothetical protein
VAKIGQPQSAPLWPWGGPRAVRERLVDRAQLDRKNVRKKGDPKNPALASAELLEFIGPGHTSEELRLPMPPPPAGHDADVESYMDRQVLASVAGRLGEDAQVKFAAGLSSIEATPERLDRLKSLLAREAEMLALVAGVSRDVEDIERKRRAETRDEIV